MQRIALLEGYKALTEVEELICKKFGYEPVPIKAIYESASMDMLFVDMDNVDNAQRQDIATFLKCVPIPTVLMESLATGFNPITYKHVTVVPDLHTFIQVLSNNTLTIP